MVRTFGALVRRRWRVVAVTTIAFLFAGALWAAAQTPRYRSSVTLARVPASLPDTGIALPDLASLLTSPEVAAQVEAASGLPVSTLDASLRQTGTGLTIDTTASDAALAQRGAQGFGDALTATTVRIGAEPATGFELRAPAQVPAEPFSPDLGATALVTGVFGVALGTAAAVAVERLRGTTTQPAGRRRNRPVTAPLATVEPDASAGPIASADPDSSADPDASVDPALEWFLELSRAAAFDDDDFDSAADEPDPDHLHNHDADPDPDGGVDPGASQPEPVAAGMPVADLPRVVAPRPTSRLPVADLPPRPPHASPASLPASSFASHTVPVAVAEANVAPSPAVARTGPGPFSSLVAADGPSADHPAATQPGVFSLLVDETAPPRPFSAPSFSFSALALGELDDADPQEQPDQPAS